MSEDRPHLVTRVSNFERTYLFLILYINIKYVIYLCYIYIGKGRSKADILLLVEGQVREYICKGDIHKTMGPYRIHPQVPTTAGRCHCKVTPLYIYQGNDFHL